MLRPQGEQLRDRLVPTVVRLVRKTGDQVETDVLETSVAKNLSRSINLVAAVHAARGFQFVVVEGLHAHADAIESRLAPCGALRSSDRFGIGFERDLFEFAFESGTHGIEDSRKARRFKQAWGSPAEIGRIENGFRDFRDAGFPQQAGMSSDFATDRFDIWNVQIVRKHTSVKVAVGALGLAKRNLHIQSQSHGQTKTLAQGRGAVLS